MVEIMLALSVFAVAVLGVISYQQTINQVRQGSMSKLIRAIAINNVASLVEGTAPDELARDWTGNPTYAPERRWSLSRIQNVDTPLTTADLVTYGIISQTELGAIKLGGDVRVYLEYYRSTANLDSNSNPINSQPGILDVSRTTPTAFMTEIQTNPTLYRVVPDTSCTNATGGLLDPAKISTGNPVMIRLVVQEGTRVIHESFLGTYNSSDA